MHDTVYILAQLVEGRRVGNVSLKEAEGRVIQMPEHVLDRPHSEVIDANDLMPACHELVEQVGSQKSCDASDHYAHA
jgi:hypothetical protein